MSTDLAHDADRPRRRTDRSGDESRNPAGSWDRFLPAGWSSAVDPPLYVEHYREYEIAAQRSVGYDADDRPCFTAHEFTLTRSQAAGDAPPREVIAYAEEMAAWRLHDQRWLVFRLTRNDPGGLPRSFYALSPEMPR